MGFTQYSTARKTHLLRRFVFLTLFRIASSSSQSWAARNARLFPTLLGRPLRSRLIRSGRRLAERNALPAYACGNARRRVLSLGEDATPAMLSAEPSEPLRSRPSSRLQASLPRHPPRRQSGLQAVPTRDSPRGRQDSVRQAVHRPAVPAEDCRLRRQSSDSGQFAIRSLATRSSAVIVLLIILVDYSLDIPVCVITLHSFPTLLLYALKKNKKSAKVVRLMVSVKVTRLSPSASRNLD